MDPSKFNRIRYRRHKDFKEFWEQEKTALLQHNVLGKCSNNWRKLTLKMISSICVSVLTYVVEAIL